MIKLKKLVKFLFEEETGDVANYIPPVSTKSINDEFQVDDWMMKDIEKMLEKVNKKLKARHLPELKLNILKSEWVEQVERKKNKLNVKDPFVIKKFIHTVKVEGDIPEIKDYEFIAKIEHGSDGNIINMAPNSSVEKLPDMYKTHSQKCDICHTDRERNNTFIIKKVDTGELICAGSSCLKKFMPLEAVKAMVDYSIQLNDLRDALFHYEELNYSGNGEDEDGYYGGGRGGSRWREVYEPDTILAYCLIAYFDAGGEYISKTKAYELNKPSTIGNATALINVLQSPVRNEYDRQERRRAQAIVDKYKDKATEMAGKILEWAKAYDFDKAALENPKMDSYYHNLKVLLGRKFLEQQHLGYFSSIISLYLREMEIKAKPKATSGMSYYGEVGQKIVDLPVEVQFITSYDTQYGTMHVYNMVDEEGHLFVYKGKILEIPGRSLIKGDRILLSGTIKSHQEYKGKMQTVIQRPKVKEKL